MMFHERYERYEQALKAWNEKLSGIFDAKRRARDDVQRAKRDVVAARLAQANAELHLADLEKQVEKHRKHRPEKPEPHDG